MRKDKEEVIKLRKTGKSYNEIREELSIPKSTLSEWFRDQKWSNELAVKLAEKQKSKSIIRMRDLNKIRGANLDMLYKEAEKEAVEEFEQLKYHPLFMSALMIYWGEGNKASRNNCIIANTEYEMVRIFKLFLERICRVKRSRIRAWILLYPDLDEKVCKNYWMRNIGLKQEDFNKSIVIQGKHKTNKLQYGVCNLGVSSTYLKKKILLWIKLLAEDISNEKYFNK
jgi:hypothetical protein